MQLSKIRLTGTVTKFVFFVLPNWNILLMSIMVQKCTWTITCVSEYRKLTWQSAPQMLLLLRVNSCIYPKLKIMLTFTLTLETGACFSKVPKSHLWTCLLRKADLLRCFQGNKKRSDCEVWRLKSSPFLRYRGNNLWHVKMSSKVSGLSRNGPQVSNTETQRDTSCWLSKLGMNLIICISGHTAASGMVFLQFLLQIKVAYIKWTG